MEPGRVAGVIVWENTLAAPVRVGRPPNRRPACCQRAYPIHAVAASIEAEQSEGD
jgi:hypothetical protein